MAKVLVVDDEYGIRLTLREFLLDEGYDVDTAESFDEAVVHLKRQDYDVVVTDVILPRRNGLDLLRHLHDTTPEVQVIIITGEPTVELTVQAMRLGAFDFIAKPVSGKDLCDVVFEAAQKKSQYDQAEEMLRESESRYHMLFDAAADAIFIFDERGHVQEVNRTACEKLGFSRSELLAQTCQSLFSDLPEPLAEKAQAQGFVYETRIVRKNALPLPVELSIRQATYFGESGWMFLVRDISERRKTQEQLLRFSAAVHASTDAVLITDLSGTIMQVNDAAVRMFGGENEAELLGQDGMRFMVPDFHTTAKLDMEEILQTGRLRSLEYSVFRKDGSTIPVEASISIMNDAKGAVQGFAAILRDISERKRAEAALRRSEEKLAGTLACISDLVFGINHEACFVEFYQSSDHPELYVKPDFFLGRHVGEVLPSDIAERFLSALRNVEQRKDIFEFDYQLEVNGKPMWFSARCSTRKDEQDQPDGILAIVRNIHSYKQAEQSARQKTKELAFLTESAQAFMQVEPEQDLYALIGRQLRHLATCRVIVSEYKPETDSLVCRSLQGLGPATHKILSMLGGSPVGRSFPITDEEARKNMLCGRVLEVEGGIRALVFGQIPLSICNLITQALDIGKVYGVGFIHAGQLLGTAVMVLRRGEDLPLRTVEAFAGQAAIALHRERLQSRGIALENQLHQARKLESLGRLTSTVAHDFNNLLTGLIGNVALAQMELSPGHAAEDYLNEVHRAVDKAAELTGQLLGISRKRDIKTSALELSELIASNRNLLQRLLGEDIRLELDLSPNLPSLMADRGHLEQVLLNLAANARDALPEGGTVLLRTWRENLLPELFSQERAPDFPREVVKLSFEDDGPGMEESVRHLAFEAFFTTKQPGHGTGLGLATVAEVMRGLGGSVTIEAPETGGTRFVLTFPPVGSASVTPLEIPLPIPGGTETLLLLEQDEQVRRTLQNSLLSLGYRVLSSPDANGLRKLAIAAEQLPALLIADQLEQEQYQLLREHFPTLRFLFTSGNQDGVIVHAPYALVGTLCKPFSQKQLAVKIRDLLR